MPVTIYSSFLVLLVINLINPYSVFKWDNSLASLQYRKASCCTSARAKKTTPGSSNARYDIFSSFLVLLVMSRASLSAAGIWTLRRVFYRPAFLCGRSIFWGYRMPLSPPACIQLYVTAGPERVSSLSRMAGEGLAHCPGVGHHRGAPWPARQQPAPQTSPGNYWLLFLKQH